MPILHQEPVVFPPALLTDYTSTSSTEQVAEELETQRAWWAIYTRSRQEKSLARKLYANQVPFYLPLVECQHVYRGRKVKSFVPLFSGYMFLYGTDDERVAALSTNCVSRMFPVEDHRQLLRDLYHINQLIEAAAPMTVEQRLQPGRKVRVKSGPLAGLEGVVIQRRSQNRLLVSVQYIQQGISLAIEDFMLEPI